MRTLGSTVPEWMHSEKKPLHLAMSVTFNKFRLVTPHKLGKNDSGINKGKQTLAQELKLRLRGDK